MYQKLFFYICSKYTIPAANNHILKPTDNGYMTVLVEFPEIAGMKPSILERFLCFGLVLSIFTSTVREPECYFPDFPDRLSSTLLIYNLDLV